MYPWGDHSQILPYPEGEGFGLVKRLCTCRAPNDEHAGDGGLVRPHRG